MKRHIWIDISFSDKEVEGIISAFKTVECSTNYSIVEFDFFRKATIADLVQMSGPSNIVVVATDSNDIRIKRKDTDFKIAGKKKHTVGLFLSREEIPTILMVQDRIDNYSLFYKVAIHEAIHASMRIMIHSESNSAVMNASMDETSAEDMTGDDLKLICDIYQCKASDFKICKG